MCAFRKTRVYTARAAFTASRSPRHRLPVAGRCGLTIETNGFESSVLSTSWNMKPSVLSTTRGVVNLMCVSTTPLCTAALYNTNRYTTQTQSTRCVVQPAQTSALYNTHRYTTQTQSTRCVVHPVLFNPHQPPPSITHTGTLHKHSRQAPPRAALPR